MSEVSILRLRHLAETLEKEPGGEHAIAPVLRACGITTAHMTDPRCRITIRQEAEVIRRISEILADPLSVARAGLAFRDAATLTAYVARSCKTLEQALDLASQYLALSDSDTTLTLNPNETGALLALRSRSETMDKEHRHREFLVFAVLARLRRIAGAEFAPLRIVFRHDIRGHKAGLERLAGCSIHVDQPETGIILSRSTLNLPISTADPELRAYLRQHGDNLLSTQVVANPPLPEQVEAVLLQSLPGKLPSAEDVAARVGMSRRTMSRKLKEFGRTYRAILDDVRLDLAETLLRDTHSRSEIAFLLDYADQAAFQTAFKRWTGVTPNTFRSSPNA
jgi:AraC-like DNA-binding protein